MLNKVHCFNLLTAESFTLEFEDVYAQRKFLRKLKYSKKIKCIGWETGSPSEDELLISEGL